MRYSAVRKLALIVFGTVAVALFWAGGSLRAAEPATRPEGGAIKGVVKTPWVRRYQALVSIVSIEGQDFPPPEERPFMSQKSLVFRPRILPVVKGTTVDFTNNDNVVHNIFAPPGSTKTFNLGTYGQGVKKAVTFEELGEVTLLCNVHPEMVAYILVVQNPYFGLTDKKGNFEIKGVPPGKYRLKVWHEKLKEVSQEVVVEAGKTAVVEFAKKEFKKR